MTFRFAEYCREKWGSDVVALQSEGDLDQFVDAIDAFFKGTLTAASLREALFGLGVPAPQIRRLLAGERLISASPG